MFYSCDILQRRSGEFGIIWIAATKCNDLTRRDYYKVDVAKACNLILDYILLRVPPSHPGGTKPRFSLYLSSQLMYGTAVIYGRLCQFLLTDTQHLIERFGRMPTSNATDIQPKTKRTSLNLPELNIAQMLVNQDFGMFKTLPPPDLSEIADIDVYEMMQPDISMSPQFTPKRRMSEAFLTIPHIATFEPVVGKAGEPHQEAGEPHQEAGEPHQADNDQISIKELPSYRLEVVVPDEQDLPPLLAEELIEKHQQPEEIDLVARNELFSQEAAREEPMIPKPLQQFAAYEFELSPYVGPTRPIRGRKHKGLQIDHVTKLTTHIMKQQLNDVHDQQVLVVRPDKKVKLWTQLSKVPASGHWCPKLMNLLNGNCKTVSHRDIQDEHTPYVIPQEVWNREIPTPVQQPMGDVEQTASVHSPSRTMSSTNELTRREKTRLMELSRDRSRLGLEESNRSAHQSTRHSDGRIDECLEELAVDHSASDVTQISLDQPPVSVSTLDFKLAGIEEELELSPAPSPTAYSRTEDQPTNELFLCALDKKLNQADNVFFSDLCPPGTSKKQASAVFCAILDSLKRNEISVVQEVPFGEMLITRGENFPRF